MGRRMQSRRRLVILALAAGALVAAAGCYSPARPSEASDVAADGEVQAAVPTATPVPDLPSVVILSVDTPTPAPVVATPVPTSVPIPLPTATPEPVTTGTPEPTPTSEATPTPEAAPTSEATSTPVAMGSPFTSIDLESEIVARGLSYSPREERSGCTGRAAEVRRIGGADGLAFTLWVYPTPDELKADWVLPSSGAPTPRIAGCEIDGGWTYWHENLVIAFEPQASWIPEGATRETVVEAFFALTR
jgi:hypothetical protein